MLAGADIAQLDRAMERAAAMDPFPEAAAALDELLAAGLRLAVLINSTAEGAEAALQAAGLRTRFAAVVGSDAVGCFKPHRDVYSHGLRSARRPAALRLDGRRPRLGPRRGQARRHVDRVGVAQGRTAADHPPGRRRGRP